MLCVEGCGVEVLEGRTHCQNCGAPQERLQEEAVVETSEEPPAEEESPPEQVQPLPLQVEDSKGPEQEFAEESDEDEAEPKPLTKFTVTSACQHDLGHVQQYEDDYGKENDQDFTRTVVIDYPQHGYRVVLQAGADGIGSSTGGERSAQGTVDLLLGALGMRMPAFGTQEAFMFRESFGEVLVNKVAKWFFPVCDWVHKMVYAIGENEYPPRKGARQLYGCTFTLTVTIVDLKTGRVMIYGYWVGDSRVYLITRDICEQLTRDHDRLQGSEHVLDKYVGQMSAANGETFVREMFLTPDSPFVGILHCSDGLTNMVAPEDFAEVCRNERPEQAVEKLINMAINCEVPYGLQFQAETATPIQPGDDNVFANYTTVQGESE